MGEYLREIEERRRSPEAIAHRIALFLTDNSRRAVVVESVDDVFFYASLLRRKRHRMQVEFYPANGRLKVVSSLEILKQLGKLERSFGIVDRDFWFDDPMYLIDKHCLVLDVYSFENYFMDTEFLAHLGHVFFGLEPHESYDRDWRFAVAAFLSDLRGCLVNEHAIAVLCRRRRQICNLQNFNPKSYLSVGVDGKIDRARETAAAFFKDTSAVVTERDEEEIASVLDEIGRIDLARIFRGHYFWSMFVVLMNVFRLRLDSEFRVRGRNRTRTRSELTERHVIEASTNLLAVPPIIDVFFDTVIST